MPKLCFFLSVLLTLLHAKSAISDTDIPFSAQLEGAAFVTSDIDASVDFYTQFLGFREHKRIKLSSEASLGTFGVEQGNELEYAALIPAAWSKENPNLPGLNFVEISDGENNPFNQNGARKPIVGEIIKAYLVSNLEGIEKQMRASGVPVVTPLLPSQTGKSLTLTVLDPNGVRVQLYEYIKQQGD